METSRLKFGELMEHPVVRAIMSQAMYRNKDSNYNEGLKFLDGGPGKFVFTNKHCSICHKAFTPKARTQNVCSIECKLQKSVEDKFKGYGLSLQEYLQMYDSHDGCCHICGGAGFLMRAPSKNSIRYHVLPLCVDHDHGTGKVRGLLCHNCNRAIGLLHDDIGLLNKAVQYLEGATTISKESTLKRVEAPNS